MRVAHVITRMIIGGAQENTLFNCQDLVSQYGDQVLLLTGPAEGPEGRLLEQGRADNIDIQPVPDLVRPIHPGHDWQAYRQLVSALRTFRPQVVHTHSAKAGFLGRLAAWKCQVPAIVHTVHGAPFHPYQSAVARQLFIRLERLAARRCHHMISVADAMTDLLVEAGVAPRERFTTIYSGMDVEPFRQCQQQRAAARKKLGFQDDHVVFGKVARLFHLKGHEYLIQAASQVVRQHPQSRFLLVGDGVLRDSLEKQIAELGLQDHFVLTGLVAPEEVPFYLSAMDALVHTSLREGLARTLPQALIAGIPAVSFDVDGAREVVHTHETGFLIPAGDIAKLSQALITLAGDSPLRQRLGHTGQSRYTERFRHQEMTRQIRQLYQHLLDHQTSRPSS